MKYLLRTFLFLFFLLPFASLAQDAEMADQFRSEGKIYVVIAVMTVILAGIFGYLLFLGIKISRLEKKLNERK